MTSDDEKLKPCPFCDGKAQIKSNIYARVECTKCFVISRHYNSNELAIEGWNMRSIKTHGTLKFSPENKIISGLKDALEFANGDESKGTVTTYDNETIYEYMKRREEYRMRNKMHNIKPKRKTQLREEENNDLDGVDDGRTEAFRND